MNEDEKREMVICYARRDHWLEVVSYRVRFTDNARYEARCSCGWISNEDRQQPAIEAANAHMSLVAKVEG